MPGTTCGWTYLVYTRVCEKEKTTPMTHLDFHVAVATAWCTTPALVLKPTAAAAAVPAPASPATAVPPRARARARTTPVTGGATPAAIPNQRRQSRYDERTKEKFVAWYTTNPAAHKPVPPKRDSNASAKDCQVCNAGFGTFAPDGARLQKKASMACEVCTIHVCSGECWQILHGAYQGEYNLLSDKACQEADEEGEEDEDEDDDEEGDDDERGAQIMHGMRA